MQDEQAVEDTSLEGGYFNSYSMCDRTNEMITSFFSAGIGAAIGMALLTDSFKPIIIIAFLAAITFATTQFILSNLLSMSPCSTEHGPMPINFIKSTFSAVAASLVTFSALWAITDKLLDPLPHGVSKRDLPAPGQFAAMFGMFAFCTRAAKSALCTPNKVEDEEENKPLILNQETPDQETPGIDM